MNMNSNLMFMPQPLAAKYLAIVNHQIEKDNTCVKEFL